MSRVLALLTLWGCRSESLGAWTRGQGVHAEEPNVLVISIDTLRADHLPGYGCYRRTAPHLAQIAAQGAQLDRSWSQAPVTDGTHASLFTGLYQSEHGKFSHEQRLGDDQLTMAEHFRSMGYRSFAIASSLKFIRKSGFAQGFEDYDVLGELGKNQRSEALNTRLFEHFADDDPAPWFGFIHYFDVHAPYSAPEPYRSSYLAREPTIQPEHTHLFIQAVHAGKQTPSAADRLTLSNLYDGQIRFVDQFLAQVWERLDSERMANHRDTLVVLFSDHGEGFMEHGYLGHGKFLYEELLRVPVWFWWPGHIPAGQHISEPFQTVDIFPTLSDLAGLPAPPRTSGRSFAPLLRGDGPITDTSGEMIVQSTRFWGIIRDTPQGRFKLTVRLKDHKQRLVRVDQSPPEDVTGRFPTVQDALMARLATYDFDDPHGRSITRDDFKADELEALKQMGYIEE